MSKKSRNRPRSGATGHAADPTAPNPRQPCPCGSGKRYKACHGAGDADVIVLRPFVGLAAEADLVALREFVPSGLAPLPLAPALAEDLGERPVSIASVLPGAAAALVRTDGSILVGMQTQTRTGDLSGDLARALRWACGAEPGSILSVSSAGLGVEDGAAPVRLQDLMDVHAPLEITVHRDFTWWLPPDLDGDGPTAEMTAALEHANNAIMPTEPVTGTGVHGAYWTDAGEKAHIRWVRPEPEERLLTALARLSAAEELALGEGSKYAGSFRAHGLLVPVWDLDHELHAKEWATPAETFVARLTATLADLDSAPTTHAERRARESIAGRLVTLR